MIKICFSLKDRLYAIGVENVSIILKCCGGIIFFKFIYLTLKIEIMTNNLQDSDLQVNKTPDPILGKGAEKYIKDSANIEDLPGDDEDLEIDDDAGDNEDTIEAVDYSQDVFDVETEMANKDVTIVDEDDEDDTINLRDKDPQ